MKTDTALNLRSASTRTIVAMLISALLGAALSATWFLIREKNRKSTVVIERIVGQQTPPANSAPTPQQQQLVIPSHIAREPEPLDEAVAADLVKLFPDFETQSFEHMATTLRKKALEEFGDATVAMQETLAAAQKEMSSNASSRTESERVEAVKRFQQLQQEQSAGLGEITLRLQQRIAALERMKGVGKN